MSVNKGVGVWTGSEAEAHAPTLVHPLPTPYLLHLPRTVAAAMLPSRASRELGGLALAPLRSSPRQGTCGEGVRKERGLHSCSLTRGEGGRGGQACRIRFEEEKAGKVHSCGPVLRGRKEGERNTVQFGKRKGGGRVCGGWEGRTLAS